MRTISFFIAYSIVSFFNYNSYISTINKVEGKERCSNYYGYKYGVNLLTIYLAPIISVTNKQ